jgi:hypothetical protein
MSSSLIPPALRQLALQAAAAILVLSLAWPYHLVTRIPLDWEATAYLIGIAAFALASFGRQPWWWRLIHLLFVPAAVLFARLPIDPLWFLAGFLVLFALHRGVVSEQVPLYLSSSAARRELLALARDLGAREVVDLGAGIGSVVVPLARAAPDIRWTGIEYSPLPWLIARCRAIGLPNCEIRYRNLWAVDLAGTQLAYAFLSPVPMRALWRKACREMPAGASLVSNTFAVPDAEAVETIEAEGRTLFRYEVPPPPAAAASEQTAEPVAGNAA